MKIEVKSTTKKLCIIGDPVEHSKSPYLQNAMCAALGLDYAYLWQQVSRGALPDWLAAAKIAGYAGFNATMPHKEALLPLMDVLGEDAKRCGAVNTVCIREGKLYGFNTDGAGFLAALTAAGISVAGQRVTLLGAGGAAKALALKLAAAGAGRVNICNRTAEHAQMLCAHDPEVLHPAGFDLASLTRCAAESDLLVNCTSLGMTGTAGQFESFAFLEALPQTAAVCDLIYAPDETEFLAAARERGHRTMNGLGLLLHQAILSLEYFTQTKLDAAEMVALLKEVNCPA
ncbi:MAG: shikimate dehydrogenase [Pseudoflavonifractor sp.]